MSSIFDGIGDEGVEQLDENLRKWFKEKWVRFGPDGKIRGACARGDDSEGKPKCLPQKKAHSLGKKGRKYAASKKRREDPNPERRGKAKNVATKKKTKEDIQVNEKWSQKYKDSINCSNPKGFSQKAHCAGKKKNEDMHEESKKCPYCGGPMYPETMINEKQDACYHKVKSRYKVWPSAYASGALVQCRKKGASNWGTGGKKNESNIMKGIVDESENVLVLYIDGKPSTKYAKDHEARGDLERLQAKYPNKKFELKREMREGVIIGHDKDDPQVAVLGGAGSYSLSNLKKKAQMEASELAKDVANGKFKNSAYNVKQLTNTLNTIVAAEDEMEKLYFGEDYTGEFAAEVTPAINPYGGLKDRKHRGAISETPTDNPTGASGEGGWRRTDLDEYREMSPELRAAQKNLIALRNKEKSVNVPGKRERVAREPTVADKPKAASVLTKGAQDVDPATQDAIAAFLAKGGEIKKGRPGKAPPTGRQQASKHIGGGGKYRKRSDTPGQGANYRGAAIVAVEEEQLDEKCWKGYHKEGNKKMFGKTYPNCVKNTNEEEQLDEKCWDTHKQVGMKKKGDKMVPNCVPKESAIMKGIKRESK